MRQVVKNSALANASSGVVSLLTSIVVALLLIVITVSGVGIMNSELRQATDFDLSTKAYFAAESGLEDAIDAVRGYLQNDIPIPETPANQCGPLTPGEANLSGDGVITYTCQTVRLQQTELVGELKKEGDAKIDLTGLDFNEIRIAWNQEGTTDPNFPSAAAIPTTFPPGSNWTDTYPAVLEVSIISYPRTSSFDSSQISKRTIFLKPNLTASATGNEVNMASNFAVPFQVACAPSATAGNYECEARLTNPPAGSHHIVNIHARYSSTHYRVQAYQGSTQLNIPNSQIIIDVTGKARDVFRRIQAKAFLGQSSSFPFSILTDDNICKVLTVTGSTASSESGC